MSKIDKKKLPSRHTSLGPDRAPHRSFYYAMGETEQDVANVSEEISRLLLLFTTDSYWSTLTSLLFSERI